MSNHRTTYFQNVTMVPSELFRQELHCLYLHMMTRNPSMSTSLHFMHYYYNYYLKADWLQFELTVFFSRYSFTKYANSKPCRPRSDVTFCGVWRSDMVLSCQIAFERIVGNNEKVCAYSFWKVYTDQYCMLLSQPSFWHTFQWQISLQTPIWFI